LMLRSAKAATKRNAVPGRNAHSGLGILLLMRGDFGEG
jgi:hypothetical protein